MQPIQLNHFLKSHLLQLLALQEENGSASLDREVHRYFRLHRNLGSRDRRLLRDFLYAFIRRWDPKKREGEWERALEEWGAPIPWKESFPEWLLPSLVQGHGEAQAQQIVLALQEEAPLTVRANRLKCTRKELAEELAAYTTWRFGSLSSTALIASEKVQLLQSPSYRMGHFEIQDEGSQAIADFVGAQPGERGLDLCAGSGGKALALGGAMENRGQLYLHDVRIKALGEAKKRLARAGVQNVQYIAEKGRLHPLKGSLDWVLVDAPCSGSGSWRRMPEMKWRLHPRWWQELQIAQRQLIEEALLYLHPKGRLIYATCSLFREENEEPVGWAKRTYGLVEDRACLSLLPKPQGHDGFFAASLHREGSLSSSLG